MDKFLTTKKIIHKWIYPDMANYIIDFIEDPKKKWARNLYKMVLDDINEFHEDFFVYNTSRSERLCSLTNNFKYKRRCYVNILRQLECRDNMVKILRGNKIHKTWMFN